MQNNRERLIDGRMKAIIVNDDRIEVCLTYYDEAITIPTIEELDEMKASSPVNTVPSPRNKDIHSDVLIFLICVGIERPLKKHAGGMFLGRGRFHLLFKITA